MTRLAYLKAFFKSWTHAGMALLTLGIPFATGEPLAFVIGAAAYVLGWVFVGDSRWFRRKIDAAELVRLSAEEARTMERLQAERSAKLAALPKTLRQRYAALAEVCRDIESQLPPGGFGDDMWSAARLDGLMWSYLGLLGSEQTLAGFIEKEEDEAFGERIGEAEARLQEVQAEVAAVAPGTRDYEIKMQLVGSREEGLAALRRRAQQFERARENLDLVRAEQERIAEQLKLLRADLYASKAVGQISQRLNETIDQLASSSRISADVAPAMTDLPAFRTRRVGYDLHAE